jgi:Zn-dependent protease with chaperone function
MIPLHALLAFAAAHAATGPATQPPFDGLAGQASSLRAADLRVASVGFRIAVSGKRFCPNSYPVTGLLLHHLAEYDAAGQRIQVDRHQIDRGPGVLAAVAASPAALAGLQAGDVLIAVNGGSFTDPRRIAKEADDDRRRRMIEADEALIETALRLGPARLRLLRDGKEIETTLHAVAACPVRIRLAYSRQPTAFSNRGYVIVTTRVLELIRSDDELAVVIGHELGHHVLDHEQRLDDQKVPKGLLRGFGRNASRIRAVEAEADRFGLRIAAQAGYEIAATAGMWERLAKSGWRGPQLFRTHPSVSARVRMIQEVLAETR